MGAAESYTLELSKAAAHLHNQDIKLSYTHLETALQHLKSIPLEGSSSVSQVSHKAPIAAGSEVEPSQLEAEPEVLSHAEDVEDLTPQPSGKPVPPSLTKYQGKIGRSAHTSAYNPSTPILPNSQVAYKPKSQASADWIQCRVLRVVSEAKFEIQDPEPDELNPEGAIFKATSKEVILILDPAKAKHLKPYKPGMRVLARYPETTVFYPAEVVDCGPTVCKLIFEGEEEEDKITSVQRPYVLPM